MTESEVAIREFLQSMISEISCQSDRIQQVVVQLERIANAVDTNEAPHVGRSASRSYGFMHEQSL